MEDPNWIDWVLRDTYSLNYDSVKGLLTQPEGWGMIVNRNPNLGDLYYLVNLTDVIIKLQSEPTSYVPANPRGMYGYQYDEDMGYGKVGFTISPYTQDYVLLDQNNLYYEVWLDDEQVEVDVDGVLTTEIPFNFTSNIIKCYADERTVKFTHEVNKVKVRACYMKGDEKFYTDYADLTFVESGIDRVEGNVAEVPYFDLQGRCVINPERGSLLVKKTTMENGDVRYSKIIR